MMMDLHVHTKYSLDATGEPREIAKFLKKKGFDGMAVTDHNTIAKTIRKCDINIQDFLIIPGIEVSTSKGHLIGLGIKERIKRGLSLEETIEKIHDFGGIVIVPHPYRLANGIGKKAGEISIEAIETFNGRNSFFSNLMAQHLAKKLDVGGVGGSDAHSIKEAGNGYTILSNVEGVEDVLNQIEKGKTIAGGKNSFLPSLDSLFSFMKRGFKRI